VKDARKLAGRSAWLRVRGLDEKGAGRPFDAVGQKQHDVGIRRQGDREMNQIARSGNGRDNGQRCTDAARRTRQTGMNMVTAVVVMTGVVVAVGYSGIYLRCCRFMEMIGGRGFVIGYV
jgi:hypothetical protein